MKNNFKDENDFLAFEYAAGLLNKEQKSTISRSPEFQQALKKWQLKLVQLNFKSPLKKSSSKAIWRKIKADIKAENNTENVPIIDSIIQTWQYLTTGIIAFGILAGVIFWNTSQQLEWSISLENQQLFTEVTTHEHTDNKKVCTLWVKSNNQILLIGKLPETGKKTIIISKKIRQMIENGDMIVSIEDKAKTPLTPSIIEYQQKWII